MCARCFRYLLLLFGVWLFAASCSQQPEPTMAVAPSGWQRVDVPGGSLEYQVSGSGGEPVLLIHGSVFADVFDGLLQQPALGHYRLITYHRRGFAGSSRATPPFTIEQQAADAIALLDQVGAPRAHVVGHSYGGSVALQLARQYPRRVASMVLMEAAVPALSPLDPKLMEGAQHAAQLYAKGDARGAIRHFGNLIAPGSWEAMTAAGATAMQEQGVKDAATFFDVEMPALMQWQFGLAEAGAQQTPALLVVGGNSSPRFRAAHTALLRALPRANEKVIDGVGHELQMQQPQAVADAINVFLRKHPVQ
jgi:pimeloyl-ACP methyl ester carboxylesterase